MTFGPLFHSGIGDFYLGDIIAGRVAVEVNLKVIKKVEFETYRLHEGDSVEIVYFVGGG